MIHTQFIMKNKILVCFFLLSLFRQLSLEALKNDDWLSYSQAEPRLFINNRILAKVNGKPISTFDLMKKMDLSFYRQYPEYASFLSARYEYYQVSWRYLLEEIIDKELILADAQENKVEISSGDVRQEMESSFGPHIIANLDKIGLGFDEASKLMHEELIIRRMIAGRVHTKAFRMVTPTKVRQAYEAFIQDPANARLTQWTYRMITIKDQRLPKTETAAKAAYHLLKEGFAPEELDTMLQERKEMTRRGKVTISNPITQNELELSKDYLEVLSSLEADTYSEPFIHKSRSNQTKVCRILQVQNKIPGGLPSFKEMETTLKDKLLDETINQETDNYLKKLRQHYHIRISDLEASLPSDYQPFLLTGR